MELLAPYLDKIAYYFLEIVTVVGEAAAKLIEAYFTAG